MNIGMTAALVALTIFSIALLVRDMVINDKHEQLQKDWERAMAKAEIRVNRAESKASREETKRIIMEVEMESRVKQLEAKLSHVASIHSEELEKLKEKCSAEVRIIRSQCDAELAQVYKDYTEERRMHEMLKEAHERMLDDLRKPEVA